MKVVGLDAMSAEIAAIQPSRWVGRVVRLGAGTISVSGLSDHAALGDLVEIQPTNGAPRRAEVLHLEGALITILPDGAAEGCQIGDRVILLGASGISPDESWLGRVVDPYGNATDGRALLRGPVVRPLRAPAPAATERRGLGARLETGLAVFNTILPIVRGQRIGLFAGSGVGKSTLLGKLALGLQADVVVVAMVGERGREVREFTNSILGRQGMQRAVVVAATSDQSAVTRRRCAWAAMAVAEHFRDAGRHVLFIIDSVSRFADAHREVALAAGEPASMRGFPPSTAHTIAALCERAGPGAGLTGDITAVFNVLVAGSDMNEPVADMLRGVLDGHVVLSRDIAERGRFPAVDVLRSVSRALPQAASAEENALIARARQRLGTYDKSALMIQAGLYAPGSDQDIDAAIAAFPRLDAFMAENAPDGTAESFRRLAACLQEPPAPGDEPPTAASPGLPPSPSGQERASPDTVAAPNPSAREDPAQAQ